MANDLWRTPRELVSNLDKEFHFMADMASSHENAVCMLHFTEEEDSLSFDWSKHSCLQSNRLRYVWCNPPYSDPYPWIQKAIEAQLGGLGVVMLLNCDHSVGWFAEAYEYVSEIRYIIPDEKKDTGKFKSGRIAFLNEKSEPVNGNSKGQFILIFNPFKIGTRHTMYVGKSALCK